MHPSLRASDADRDQLVDVLKEAFAEGRLSQDEYTDRMGRAYTAKTYGELAALAGDLPSRFPPAFPAFRPAPTNSLAVASMVFGLLEFFTMGLTAIPAVALGHKARRQIRMTGERGSGMATTGLVLGWTAIGLFALLILGAVLAMTLAAHGGAPAGGLHFFHGTNAMLTPVIQHHVRQVQAPVPGAPVPGAPLLPGSSH